MLKHILAPIVLLLSISTFGQATLFTEDFESGIIWTTSGDLSPNTWIDNSCAGNGPSIAGATSMYITKGGSVIGCGATGTEQYAYGNAPAATTFESVIYHSVDATCASALSVDFDYRLEGVIGTDFTELVYSTDGGSTWILVGSAFTISALWTSSSIALPALLDGTTFDLGYRFTCDDATVIGAPIAFDNVVVTGTDIINPVLVCPGSIDLIVDGSCLAICADYTKNVLVSDNCTDTADIVLTQSVPEFSVFPTGPGGFESITVFATDESGNTSQCTITLNIIDTEAPSVICPGDTTVAVDSNCDAITPDYTTGVPSIDNCTSFANLVFSQTPLPATPISGAGVTTPMTVTVLDEDGNSTLCSFNMISIDTTVTQITCPADSSVYVDVNCQYILADYTSAVVLIDNCTSVDSLTIVQSPPSGATITADQLITMTVTGGTPATPQLCTFTALLFDTIAPTILCPAGVSQYVDNSCTVALMDYTSAGGIIVENCATGNIVTQSPIPGSLVGVNPTETITLTVIDSAGNTGACQLVVAIIDSISPMVICPSTQFELADTSCLATLTDYTSLAVPTDNCSPFASITVTQSPLPGSVIGATQLITLTATDQYANSSTCSFNVELNDLIPPGITCPGTQTVSTDIGCDYTLVDFTSFASGTDNCSAIASLTYTQSPIAGTLLPVGTNSVAITVQDVSGNSTMCSFDVVVLDQVDPVFTTCPSIQTVFMDATCQATIGDYVSSAVAIDNCSPAGSITITQSPAAGTTIITPTIITLTATDIDGNTASCLINVVPSDTTDPMVTCPADQTLTIDASCQYVVPDLAGLVTGTDNCSILGNMTVTQNPLAASSAGGITPVLITLTDENGNSTTCVTTLLPIDITPPTITCPSSFTINNGVLCDYSLLNYAGLAAITDNCTGFTMIQTPAAGTVINPGSNQITLDVIDAGGNSASCTFELVLIETEAPVIVCPNDTASCDPIMFYTLPTFSDNCFAYLEQVDATGYTVGSTFPVGITVLEYSAIDSSGNSQTCQFNIEILDYPSPAVIPADTIELCGVTTALLEADPLTSGTGTWTLLSGQGALNNPLANTTGVNSLAYGMNVFEWSVTSATCGSLFDTIYVNVSQAPIATSIALDSLFACANNSVNLTANAPIYGSGLWTVSTSALISNPTANLTSVTLNESGWHQFNWTVTNGSCPSQYDSLFVFHTGNISAYISDSVVCIEDGTATLSADSLISGQFSFWHFTVGSGFISDPLSSTTTVSELENGVNRIIYDVAVNGCPTYMDTVTVIVSICDGFDPIFPTVITPNFDGKNDLFVIQHLEILYPGCQVTIFNRWGSLVFKSTGYADAWDGTFKGEPLPMGAYFYKIELKDAESTVYTGDISIVR
ncbi:MAG: gliding motility-associated-like protein [Flavobacteriaceae bacterium]|jgi:gliding motility-associated-like protein